MEFRRFGFQTRRLNRYLVATEGKCLFCKFFCRVCGLQHAATLRPLLVIRSHWKLPRARTWIIPDYLPEACVPRTISHYLRS